METELQESAAALCGEVAGRPLRGLVVEDSERDARLVQLELRRQGFAAEVKRVDTRDAMLAELEASSWDAVVADFSLPRFSGVEALSLPKERGLDLPLVIVSGTIDEDTAVSAMKAGAHDYVMKGNLARLAPAIERGLREAEERRERRRAEEELRRSEERYRELVENANDIVFTLDLTGHFTSLNLAGELISGYTRDEVLHMTMADVLVPQDLDLAREMTPAEIASAEADANRVVWEDRPVAIRFADEEEAKGLPLRKESARTGVLRLIDVHDFDLSACGGTHVARTGGIGVIAVSSWERFKGGQRLEFVCGGRALHAYHRLRDASAASVRQLSVLPEELPAAIERLQAEAKEQKRIVTALQGDVAKYQADERAAGAEQIRPHRLATNGRDVNDNAPTEPGGAHHEALAVRERCAPAIAENAQSLYPTADTSAGSGDPSSAQPPLRALSEPLTRLRRAFALADTLAMQYQRSTYRAFKRVLWLGFVRGAMLEMFADV